MSSFKGGKAKCLSHIFVFAFSQLIQHQNLKILVPFHSLFSNNDLSFSNENITIFYSISQSLSQCTKSFLMFYSDAKIPNLSLHSHRLEYSPSTQSTVNIEDHQHFGDNKGKDQERKEMILVSFPGNLDKRGKLQWTYQNRKLKSLGIHHPSKYNS